MKSYKCTGCGLQNWMTSEFCKRCKVSNPYSNESSANFTQTESAVSSPNIRPATNNQFNPTIQNHKNQVQPNFQQKLQQPALQKQHLVPPPTYFGNQFGQAHGALPQNFNYSGVNTICGMCGQLSNKMKTLYDQDVCKTCHTGFTNRRQAAYLIDLLFYRFAIVYFFIAITDFLPKDFSAISFFLIAIIPIPFLLKDCTNGSSLGKSVLGLKVVGAETRQPCGVLSSFSRNVIFIIPLLALVEIVMMKNKRLGDRIAKTRVVWNKYPNAPIFTS
ncbi:MAG: RDD family protein [Pyrinomonadaceae bacterium]|nr:RDD family protein [Pyrinomonadaceae bacterium]